MKKYELLKLFLTLKKSSEKGLSLVELIIALVMSGIVLTMTASGFINILRANKSVESKAVSSTGLQKALALIQEEIKQAKAAIAVTKVTGTPNYDPNCTSAVDSQECLRLDMPDGKRIYYGYKNISAGENVFLKPGILQRQVYNGSTAELAPGQTNAWEELYTTIADGLITEKPNNFVSSQFCGQDGIAWNNFDTTIYGDDSSGNGGFRFCLQNNSTSNRLVRVFLYGRRVDDKKIDGIRNSESKVSTVGFARSQ